MSSVNQDPDPGGADGWVPPDHQPPPEPEWAHPPEPSAEGAAETDPDPAPPGGSEAEALDELGAERDGYLADLQRVSAEFANFRRQASRRQAEIIEHAAAGLAEKLLPVLDACDSAIGQGRSDVGPIRGALLDVLQREGLELVAAAPAPFDPEVHEAVMHEPSEQESEPTVSEIMRSGYVWNGRVIRPAMVKVRG